MPRRRDDQRADQAPAVFAPDAGGRGCQIADDLAALVGHERERERACRTQLLDDGRLGSGRLRQQPESLGHQRADRLGISGRLVSYQHGRSLSKLACTNATGIPARFPDAAADLSDSSRPNTDGAARPWRSGSAHPLTLRSIRGATSPSSSAGHASGRRKLPAGYRGPGPRSSSTGSSSAPSYSARSPQG